MAVRIDRAGSNIVEEYLRSEVYFWQYSLCTFLFVQDAGYLLDLAIHTDIQTSVHFMCSILGSMESQISKPSIPYSCPHWETQRWQYKGREGQGDACIENRVRATQIAFYEFSLRYFQLYTFRNCKLLISTKCAGMGCDLPDIRITVCIGEAAIGDVHLYTLC